MGYMSPKVAVLAAAEQVDAKIRDSVEAAKLKKMNEEGIIDGCLVEGPISFDLAVSSEAARIKGYQSPITGDVDLMITPNIVAGNILGKSFMYMGGATMAGMILGAKIPVVLTSRGATTEEKYLSLVLCAAAS